MATDVATRQFSPLTQDLGEKIVGLTLKQAKELSETILEEVHGIKPAAGGAVMMAAPAEGAVVAAVVAEKTEFDVVLEAVFGDKKIGVIKVVRAATSLGPEGGQGPGRGRARQDQRRGLQGSRREAEEGNRGSRRHGFHQVSIVSDSARRCANGRLAGRGLTSHFAYLDFPPRRVIPYGHHGSTTAPTQGTRRFGSLRPPYVFLT